MSEPSSEISTWRTSLVESRPVIFCTVTSSAANGFCLVYWLAAVVGAPNGIETTCPPAASCCAFKSGSNASSAPVIHVAASSS